MVFILKQGSDWVIEGAVNDMKYTLLSFIMFHFVVVTQIQGWC